MTDSLPGLLFDLPLPPDLTRTLGYTGTARFVTFAWSHWNGDVLIDDGLKTIPGDNQAFSEYLRHPAVEPLVRGLGLDRDDNKPSRALVINTVRNIASAAPIHMARAFVRDQHPKTPEVEQEQRDDFDARTKAILAGGFLKERESYEEAMRLLKDQEGRRGRLLSWLDMAPIPPEQGR